MNDPAPIITAEEPNPLAQRTISAEVGVLEQAIELVTHRLQTHGVSLMKAADKCGCGGCKACFRDYKEYLNTYLSAEPVEIEVTTGSQNDG